MTPSHARSVGILSDAPLQRGRLQEAIGRFGLHTAFIGDPERLYAWPEMPDPDVWLISLADETDDPGLLDYLLERTDAPILFGLDQAPPSGTTDFFRWERRLIEKLEQQLGPLEQFDDSGTLEALVEADDSATTERPERPNWIPAASPNQPAREVWILGASLGGPAAVKAFLDHLPPDLPVGFIYAQHIDTHSTDVLHRVLGRHSHYNLKPPEPGRTVCCGDVVMMPVEQEWALDEQGRLHCREKGWPGPYGPSIDQVLLNFSDYFRDRCHAIIFSGMGNDGAIAAPLLRAHGSSIWTQDSASCGNSSMPESVAETGCSSFTGAPTDLARQLVKTLESECLLKAKNNRTSA